MIGREISHYRIIEKLGDGGMGVVYKAEDTKLNRTVALKFLRADALLSEQDRARFKHEARAVSSLEHSNICSIFEIDETPDGQTFISMPCYDGETLRQKIERGPLKTADAVDIAIQIAEGLQEAHEKGIIHRDVKSGNIIVTSRGQVKIMDFGLARTDRSTRLTSTGVTLGTVSYMSPEQATGDKVDRRTDVWSLGVILYEMLAGRLPFDAAHEQAVMYLIANKDPEPITSLRTGVPMELERITGKAMSKRPDERYQTAAEMLADLRALKRKMESETLPTAVRAAPSGARRRFLLFGVPVAVVLVLAIVWAVAGRDSKQGIPPSKPFQVTHGIARPTEPAISPDGSRITYSSDEDEPGNFDIYVIDVHGGKSQRLTREVSQDGSPAWFPDGSSLAFVSDRTGQQSVWTVGQLGGTATFLVANADYPAVSPDGRFIAFSRVAPGGLLRICVAPLDSADSVRMLTGPREGAWDHVDPAWSPDGSKICYGTRHDLWVVPFNGGRASRLTHDKSLTSEPVWSPDGRYVYYSSNREDTYALWRVSARGGTPERVTLGSSRESSPSLSRDGKRFAYATRPSEEDILIRDTRSGNTVLLPGLKGANHPSIAPDNSSIVFVSDRLGPNTDLWRQPLGPQGKPGEPVRLTDHPGNASQPVFSPDGKWIAYYRIVGTDRDIWIVSPFGGQPTQFTRGLSVASPAWSPEGSRIAFNEMRGDTVSILVASVKDGKPAGPATRVPTGDLNAYAPTWSPDGSLLAFVGVKDEKTDIWTVRSDGRGQPRQVTHGATALRARWEGPTGQLLVSGTWGGSEYEIRRVWLDGSRTESLDPPVRQGEFGALFDVSRDGGLIAYCRQKKLDGNIWVLEAEKGSF